MILNSNINTSEEAHFTSKKFDKFAICGWTLERLFYYIFTVDINEEMKQSILEQVQ